jgi:hypothetical protein
MTKEEWTRKIIKNLASGHFSFVVMDEAKDWLAGKEPPVDDGWSPSAKKKFEDKKSK